MEGKTIKVLLVEDSAFDAKLIQDLCGQACSGCFDLRHCSSLTAAFKSIDGEAFDVILLDLTLPEVQGLETLSRVSAYCPSIPVIVLTRTDDEDMAVRSVGLGAQDYLIKGQVDGALLKRAVRHGIERKQMEEELRRHRENLEGLVAARTAELIESNKQLRQEITRRNAAERATQDAFNKLKDTQAQLIQAEKMEIVGRLSSGVAHEVKNPLAIMLQGVEFLSRKVPPGREDIAETLKYMTEAVNRADNIVKGLLDFSGVPQLEKQSRDLIPVVENSLLLMKHQFDKYHVEVVRDFSADLPAVTVDNNKIEQVFLNLFENSVQAMPQGGKLYIKIYKDKIAAADGGIGKRRDDYFRLDEEIIRVRIEDTGTGIPGSFLDKVFDPFFTTKRGIGGTGLGLSIVRNIIEMHRGMIKIANRPDGPGAVVTMILKTKAEGGE